jgi:hypothetical protein
MTELRAWKHVLGERLITALRHFRNFRVVFHTKHARPYQTTLNKLVPL